MRPLLQPAPIALAPRLLHAPLTPRPACPPAAPAQLRLSGAQLEEKRQAEAAIEEIKEVMGLEEAGSAKHAELATELAGRQQKLDRPDGGVCGARVHACLRVVHTCLWCRGLHVVGGVMCGAQWCRGSAGLRLLLPHPPAARCPPPRLPGAQKVTLETALSGGRAARVADPAAAAASRRGRHGRRLRQRPHPGSALPRRRQQLWRQGLQRARVRRPRRRRRPAPPPAAAAAASLATSSAAALPTATSLASARAAAGEGRCRCRCCKPCAAPQPCCWPACS